MVQSDCWTASTGVHGEEPPTLIGKETEAPGWHDVSSISQVRVSVSLLLQWSTPILPYTRDHGSGGSVAIGKLAHAWQGVPCPA